MTSPDHLSIAPEPEWSPERRVVAVPLDGYQVTATDWLWQDRIPAGELTVLAGDGGLGKSTFAAWLAAQVTTGAMTGVTGMRTVAVVLGEDDPARTVKPRYRAAGADMRNVTIVHAEQGFGKEVLVLPDDLAELREYVALNRPELLIVDPLSAHLNGNVDTHRDGGRGGMRQVLNPLSHMAQLYGATVLAIAHLNKGSGPAGQRIGGSAAVRNAARNVLVLAPHPDARATGQDDGRRVLGHDKSNSGPTQPSIDVTITAAPVLDTAGKPIIDRYGAPTTTSLVTIGDANRIDYTDALRTASGEDDDARSTLDEALAFLRSELDGGAEIPSTKLVKHAADAGISERTLKRARRKLGVVSTKGANGWAVKLPGPDDAAGTLDETPDADRRSGLSTAAESTKGATADAQGTLGTLALAEESR